MHMRAHTTRCYAGFIIVGIRLQIKSNGDLEYTQPRKYKKVLGYIETKDRTYSNELAIYCSYKNMKMLTKTNMKQACG